MRDRPRLAQGEAGPSCCERLANNAVVTGNRPYPDAKLGANGATVCQVSTIVRMRGMESEAAEVKAAGGVVWRRGPGGVEVAVAHRSHREDWSLPKGKLDPGESWEEAALREVHEEIGFRCRLGRELASSSYTDHKGRSKVVRYWLMEPEEGEFVPNEEVDELRWLIPSAAAELLTYPHDRALVAELA